MRVRLEQESGSVQGGLYQSVGSESEIRARGVAITKLEMFLDRLGKRSECWTRRVVVATSCT